MRRALLAAALALTVCAVGQAHDFGTSITWNREMSRIVYDRCASCHREGGTSFSLMTYQDAQQRATAIKDTVLSRAMPPWGAVKGFGNFRNDTGLTQEQIELVAAWVEGGTRRGNNPNMLPEVPKSFPAPVPIPSLAGALTVTGETTLKRAFRVDGLLPEHVPRASSMQITAVLPNGTVEPLIWLYGYDERFRHPFLLRTPLDLPPGTTIRGLRPPARLILLPPTAANHGAK